MFKHLGWHSSPVSHCTVLLLLLAGQGIAAEFFVSPAGGNEPPFSSWGAAATNIQDAIDAAATGDTVWVTNGLYNTGGRPVGGQLTNRVVLDKALTVQSVNGPEVTTIMGAWDVKTNGASAVRCAWLTNGAVLNGFKLYHGGTWPRNFFATDTCLGGGACGASTNAMLVNCVLSTNSAAMGGGGAFRVTLVDCKLVGNRVPPDPGGSTGFDTDSNGGGALGCYLRGCSVYANRTTGKGAGVSDSRVESSAIMLNVSDRWAGAAHRTALVNCTVTRNQSGSFLFGGSPNGAVRESSLTNCILYANSAFYAYETNVNFTTSVLAYSCSSPLPLGEGNINLDPQLLPDLSHLAATSPCRGAGTNVSFGTDIDGQPWQNPPSMGCDEWLAEPLIFGKLRSTPFGTPVSLQIGGLFVAGQGSWVFSWSKDGEVLGDGGHYSGVGTANLIVHDLNPADKGVYQMTVSNEFGVVKSPEFDLVIRCVAGGSISPIAPYTSWETAATNIQDAIDLSPPGGVVLVTNGLYATGGRALDAGLTNRVVLDRPVVIASVNGSRDTIIEGAWDPAATNGPSAVRCAWITDGATLSGFTLRGGATLATGDFGKMQSGGGAWGTSTNALLLNCVLRSNSALFSGGGCAYLTARNCLLVENIAMSGAGSESSTLVNCLVTRNTGYGVFHGDLVNCTVTRNSKGGAVSVFTCRNSILYSNYPKGADYSIAPNSTSYTCSTRVSGLGGTNNIDADPQILGDYRLAVTSPCRGTGSAAFVSGTDFDGQPWANPPSMGCDEVWEQELVGPLTVGLSSAMPEVVQGCSLSLMGSLTGDATRVAWDYGDGGTLTNESRMATVHSWTNTGDYTVTFTAYNTEQINGISTNIVVRVVALVTPSINSPALSGTNFSLSFTTQPGVTYAVQGATNLEPPVVWQTLTNVYGVGDATVQVVDPKATNQMRFYRVWIP